MKINVKNFFKRRLSHIPPHFTTTDKRISDYEETKIDQWIHEHCVGRYCIVRNVKWQKDSWVAMATIGFEEPSDMTLLALGGMLNTKNIPF